MLEKLAAPRGVAVLAALFVLIVGLTTMPRYGVTFDAPALFYAGDRTLFAMTHPQVSGALDLLSSTEPAGFTPRFARQPDWEDPVHYPVAVDVVCAATSKVSHVWLGVLDVVDGHHLGLVLIYAFTIAMYALYASRLLGRLAGGAAVVALLLFPSAMGHSFNNPKDWPCAMFYALAVLAFGSGVVERSPRTLLASGLWLGLALSAKLNAIFAIPTLAIWLVAADLLLMRRYDPRTRRALVGRAVLVPCVAGAMFFALWPWLWVGGLTQIAPRVRGYLGHFVAQGVTQRPYWWGLSFRCLLWMTPPLILLAAAFFVVSGWRGSRRDAAVWLLLVIWLMVPLLRIAAPHVNVYDGNRHFIEYVPALCALAGMGTSAMAKAVAPRLARWPARLARSVGPVAAALAVTTLVVTIGRTYPFETTYYNVIAGGLGGAQRDALTLAPRETPSPEWVTLGSEGDYWLSSLRDAMREVKHVAGAEAVVGVCGAWSAQARANAPPGTDFKIVSWDDDAARVLYVSPREPVCSWKTIRMLEATRKTLRRVERDGGLIYELFGGPLAEHVPPVSGENWYTRNLSE